MIWQEAIKNAALRFEQTEIPDARTNAEHLALYILGFWNKSELQKYQSITLSQEQQIKFEEAVTRRIDHEPLQHIIGETEFFGLRFFTSSAALIPRSDTEILVEEVLKDVNRRLSIVDSHQTFRKNPLYILDIGTGSGAIAIALGSKLPDAIITGIDISPYAIALANKNKERMKIENVSFEIGDIFDEEISKKFSLSLDLLVSNPPYISIEEFETLDKEVRDFDPRIALTDEGDGLRFYRRIAELAPKVLKPEGKIFVEIGYNAIKHVEKIFSDAGLIVVRKVKDLQGIERVIVVQENPIP